MRQILAVGGDIPAVNAPAPALPQAFHFRLATTPDEAAPALASHPIEAIVAGADVDAAVWDDFFETASSLHPDVPVLFLISGVGGEMPQRPAFRGETRFVPAPPEPEVLTAQIRSAVGLAGLLRQCEAKRRDRLVCWPTPNMVGESRAFRAALGAAHSAADHLMPCAFAGEPGTGKKSLARLVHSRSAHANGPLVLLSCAGIVPESADLELFGDATPGRSSTARAGLDHLGLLDLARGGSLLIEDPGHLPPATQRRLTRAMHHGVFVRENGHLEVTCQTRFLFCFTTLAGTGAELSSPPRTDAEFARALPDSIIKAPPLRQRPEDVPLLAYAFLAQERQRRGSSLADFAPGALDVMRHYPWPGNVLELRHRITALAASHPGRTTVDESLLPPEIYRRTTYASGQPADGLSMEEHTDALHRELITRALVQAKGVRTQAAALLGTTPRILNYRINQLNIAIFPDPPGPTKPR